MLGDVAHPYSQHKIVILNPKGGSGKTTLATNLASYFAMRGPPPTLVDCDPGGYSLRWNDKRPADRPPVHVINGYAQNPSADCDISQFPESKEVIVDLPAALTAEEMFDHIYDASSILYCRSCRQRSTSTRLQNSSVICCYSRSSTGANVISPSLPIARVNAPRVTPCLRVS